MSTKTSVENGQLTVTRLYDAPREEVFDAWVETSKVQQWWGCGDTTSVTSEVEPKVGGKYVHKMIIKNEFESPINGVIIEYDPPKLLAYEMPSMAPDQKMTIRVTFTEKEAGTEVCLIHNNIPDDITQFVEPGWTAAFEKLGGFLLKSAA